MARAVWHPSWESGETPDGGWQLRVPVDAPQPEWGVSRVPKGEACRELYLFTTEEEARERQQEFLAAGDRAVVIQVEEGRAQRGS